jgi:hypothetical protein
MRPEFACHSLPVGAFHVLVVCDGHLYIYMRLRASLRTSLVGPVRFLHVLIGLGAGSSGLGQQASSVERLRSGFCRV